MRKPAQVCVFFVAATFLVGALVLFGVNGAESKAAAAELPSGVVAYYPFDGTAEDASGNGNNGAEQGGVQYVAGVLGKAANLDGIDDGFVVPDSDTLDLGGELTLEVWVRPTALPPVDYDWFILTKGGDALCNYEFRLFDGADFFGFGRHDWWTRWTTGARAIPGSWNHLAVTYKSGDRSSARAYLNGEQVSVSLRKYNSGSSLRANGLPLYIGFFYRQQYGRRYLYFKGAMDELVIYRRVLSAEEIRARYQEFPDVVPDKKPPLAIWHFDEGSGSLAKDSSGNGYHGTIHGATWTTQVAPKDGGAAALSFDGVNDWVDIPDNLSPQQITIEAWIYPTGVYDTGHNQGSPIITKETGAGRPPYFAWRLRITPDDGRPVPHTVGFQCFTVQEQRSVGSETPLAMRKWYHLAGTYDGINTCLYINGQLVAKRTAERSEPLVSTDLPTAIGHLQGWSVQWFQGIIDELKVYDYARTAEQIAEDAGRGEPPIPDAGPDQAVEQTSHAGTVVTLDGSGSSDDDGDELSYTWTGPFPEGGGSVTGVNPTVTLPLGTSTITLVVNDGQADSAPDTADITVQDTTPPAFAAFAGNQGGETAVTVPANVAIVDTGLLLAPGQRFSISANGLWKENYNSPVSFGPDGEDEWHAENPLPSARDMSLCGKIGDGNAFLVGSSFSGTAEQGGNLLLFCNDFSPGDNTGSVTAIITLSPPELAAITAEQADASGTLVALTPPQVSDICDADSTVTNNAPAVFPLGETTVTWTATDDSGNSATATQAVTVVDTTPPVLTVPPDVTDVEQTSADGTPVDIGQATATDICDAEVEVTNDAPEVFPLGETVVTWTATDDSGNVATGTQKVTVVDTTAPEIESVWAEPAVLWPPNHRMVEVTVHAVLSDICDAAPTYRIVGVASNEPIDGKGDGNTEPDWEITGDHTVKLRAERSGPGEGRIYTITIEASDDSGNTSTAEVQVTVPHDQGKGKTKGK